MNFQSYAQPVNKKRWSEDKLRRAWQEQINIERKPKICGIIGGAESDDMWKVLKALQEHGELTRSDIANKTGLNGEALRSRLSRLLATNRIKSRHVQNIGIYSIKVRP